MNKAFKYMGVVLGIVVVFSAIASYKYLTSDNEVGPNLITAFVGVAISAVVTLVLLSGQTKDEEDKERKVKLYERKLAIYANFIKLLWKQENIIDDSIVRETCLRELVFYLNEYEIKKLKKQVDIIATTEKREEIINAKAEITKLLRDSLDRNDNRNKERKPAPIYEYQPLKGLRGMWNDIKCFVKKIAALFKAQEDDIVFQIKSLYEILTPQKSSISNDNPNRIDDIIIDINDDVSYSAAPRSVDDIILGDCGQENIIEKDALPNNDEKEKLEQQAWHFIMLDDRQITKLKEGFKELSLIEYGEYWRTNLVKQVGKNDIVFLFRRGGYGYIGAYRAIGWRVFNFKEDREEIQRFDNVREIINIKEKEKQYLSDVKEYDIYESKNDGASTCANIIVEPIAFVEDGVGNPGGVYRRTISRYDPHYAWWLKNEFQKKGVWLEK